MNKYILDDLIKLENTPCKWILCKNSLVGWTFTSEFGNFRIEHSMPDVVWLFEKSLLNPFQWDAHKFSSIDQVVHYMKHCQIKETTQLKFDGMA